MQRNSDQDRHQNEQFGSRDPQSPGRRGTANQEYEDEYNRRFETSRSNEGRDRDDYDRMGGGRQGDFNRGYRGNESSGYHPGSGSDPNWYGQSRDVDRSRNQGMNQGPNQGINDRWNDRGRSGMNRGTESRDSDSGYGDRSSDWYGTGYGSDTGARSLDRSWDRGSDRAWSGTDYSSRGYSAVNSNLGNTSAGFGNDMGRNQTGRPQGQFSGKGPKGYQKSDERLQEDICERLTEHGEIDASEIEVKVQQGEITLSGTVQDRESKRLAEDIAESCSGVKEVHNQIRVNRSGATNPSTSGTGMHRKGKEEGSESHTTGARR